MVRACAAYQVAHLDDATGGATLGTSGGSLLAVPGDRTVGVLLDATDRRGDLGGGLATATSGTGTAAGSSARLALILQDLVERLTELGRHVEVGDWLWRWKGVGLVSVESCDASW